MKTKKASRLLALALAVTIALVPSMMVSAATIDPATGIGNITFVDNNTTVTFTIPYTMTGIDGTDQITTLVTKDVPTGNGSIAYGTDGQPTNIVYIDQFNYASATSSFQFTVDKPISTTKYFVKVGGTGINTPASSSKEITIGPIGPVIDPGNFATCVIVKDAQDVYGVTDARLVSVNISSLLTTGMGVPNDYKVVVKGTEFRFNPNNNKFVGTPLAGAAGITPADIVITKEARTVPDIIFGDLSNDAGTINTIDITYIVAKSADETFVVPNGNMSADVNGDGVINTVDITWLVYKTADETVVFDADK